MNSFEVSVNNALDENNNQNENLSSSHSDHSSGENSILSDGSLPQPPDLDLSVSGGPSWIMSGYPALQPQPYPNNPVPLMHPNGFNPSVFPNGPFESSANFAMMHNPAQAQPQMGLHNANQNQSHEQLYAAAHQNQLLMCHYGPPQPSGPYPMPCTPAHAHGAAGNSEHDHAMSDMSNLPTSSLSLMPQLQGGSIRYNANKSPFTVVGRLSLLSANYKYKVTVGEIHRRLNAPECLNASVLGGILRRAKSKDGGKSLRQELEQMDIQLPVGRRKTAPVTLLTSMTEGEAVHLANDFGALSRQHFPAAAIADYLSVKHHTNNHIERKRRRQMMNDVKATIGELHELLEKDCSPLCDSNPELILPTEVQRPLNDFSLITHGFGTTVMQYSLQCVNKWIEEMLKRMDG